MGHGLLTPRPPSRSGPMTLNYCCSPTRIPSLPPAPFLVQTLDPPLRRRRHQSICHWFSVASFSALAFLPVSWFVLQLYYTVIHNEYHNDDICYQYIYAMVKFVHRILIAAFLTLLFVTLLFNIINPISCCILIAPTGFKINLYHYRF